MKIYDVIFIGAGTSTMTAANILINKGFNNFLILDKGQPLKKRSCPGEELFTCKFCKNGCYTLEGLGGANALHGNKLCYFPASNEIKKKLDYSSETYPALNRLLSPYVDTANNNDISSFEDAKVYNSDVLDQTHFYELINALAGPVYDKILFNKHITDIYKNGEVFILEAHNYQKFYCTSVIVGSGRSSYKEIKKIFNKLKIRFSNQPQDIGIRIETHKKYFSEKYYYQVDPKFKFDFEGLGSGRTFCAHNQGKVVPVQYGNSFYSDGAFAKNFTNENNIALMTRANEYIEDDLLEKWCSEINNLANQQLVLGILNFKDSSKEKMLKNLLDSLPPFPTAIHNQLIEQLLKKLIVEDNKLFNDEFYKEGYLKVYGPAIDLYWPKPVLNNNLEANDLKNFYVIGDATGLSRGFFQGMYSGAEWANKFMERFENKELVDDKVRSGRISASV
jgi:uncharacterized FAD-dependent dehydrogenase